VTCLGVKRHRGQSVPVQGRAGVAPPRHAQARRLVGPAQRPARGVRHQGRVVGLFAGLGGGQGRPGHVGGHDDGDGQGAPQPPPAPAAGPQLPPQRRRGVRLEHQSRGRQAHQVGGRHVQTDVVQCVVREHRGAELLLGEGPAGGVLARPQVHPHHGGVVAAQGEGCVDARGSGAGSGGSGVDGADDDDFGPRPRVQHRVHRPRRVGRRPRGRDQGHRAGGVRAVAAGHAEDAEVLAVQRARASFQIGGETQAVRGGQGTAARRRQSG